MPPTGEPSTRVLRASVQSNRPLIPHDPDFRVYGLHSRKYILSEKIFSVPVGESGINPGGSFQPCEETGFREHGFPILIDKPERRVADRCRSPEKKEIRDRVTGRIFFR